MSDRVKTFIIDDNETSANLIINYLAEVEDIAEPVVLKSYNAAYKKALDEEPSLIFVDISTNQGSAIEFVKKILMILPYDILFEICFPVTFRREVHGIFYES